MKKIVCLLLLRPVVISCGENQKSESAASEDLGLSWQETPSTYAEIFIKKGGEWQGFKYSKVTFTNVDEILYRKVIQKIWKTGRTSASGNWLASDQAAFVTGIVVPIDGGFSAFSGV